MKTVLRASCPFGFRLRFAFYFSSSLRAAVAAFSVIFLAQAAPAEVGVSLGEIVIGESTNETGLSPERSTSIQKGAALAIKKFNGQGGAFGRKIRVVNYDDAYDAQKTVANVRKLIATDQVFALFQIFGSTNTSAVLPMTEKSIFR